MEIRLGGIYALERISMESEDYYWPIMEILTAYVRKNSSAEILEIKKIRIFLWIFKQTKVQKRLRSKKGIFRYSSNSYSYYKT